MSKPVTHQTVCSTSTERELIHLHAQACNSLSAALRLLTDTSASTTDSIVFSRALARAIRATTALKQACVHAKPAAREQAGIERLLTKDDIPAASVEVAA
jgi:hypothetical protein